MKAYGPWLWTLAALFAVRVIAQPLALLVDSPLLPPFESWHSGVMPYPLLIVSQLFILAWLTTTAWRVSQETVKPNRRSGRRLLSVAGVYALTMLTRLILGATMLRGILIDGSRVRCPPYFTLVSRAFCSCTANSARAPWLNCCHRFTIRRPWLGAFAAFAALQAAGMPLIVGYLRSGIVSRCCRYLARAPAPDCDTWRPSMREVRTDLIFMVVVELAPPPLVGFLFAYALVEPRR